MATETRPSPLPFSSAEYEAAHAWLLEEAEALDEQRYRDWLGLLADDVVYRMPVRVTTAHTLADTLDPRMAHFDEDLFSLTKRVERFETEHAWTEQPPSRTRRFVSNIRVYASSADDEIVARSYILLFRSRGDVRDADFVSGERTDT